MTTDSHGNDTEALQGTKPQEDKGQRSNQGMDFDKDKKNVVLVAVITPSGFYPEDGTVKVKDDTIVNEVLEKAAKHLKLTDTSDWVVNVGTQPIDPNLSFKANHLSDSVELQWHKHEGGGGAS